MAAASEPPQPDGPSPSEVTPRAGEPLLFSRYRIERELGRGGMGRVLLAFDTKLRIPVAIKLVPDEVMADAGAAEDLRTEVLRGIALTHPAIVRTHTFEQDSTGAAIVMEYIDGLTFADWKERQPGRCFDTDELLPWLEHLCAALDYAHHDARIVHRDLKPRNIMISREGRLKVSDFGISATLSETSSRTTGQGSTSGTPAYMSPQQLQGKKPSPLDDVYALGATIYDLLAGRPPFFRGTMNAIFHQLLTEPAPSITERRAELEITGKAPIPAMWEQTIAACLAKEPEDRPQSCAEVLARLRGQVSRTPPTAPATSKLTPVTPASAATSTPRSGDLQSPTPPAAPEAPISSAESGGHPPAPVGRRLKTAAPSATAPPPWRNPKWLFAIAAGILVAATVAFVLLQSKKPVGTPRRAVREPGATADDEGRRGAPSIPQTPATATKDAPFVNSLGMKFVPVPGTNVLFCIHETRRQDYATYAAEVSGVDGSWKQATVMGVPIGHQNDHPVVMVTCDDAKAFCAWLSKKEGLTYRLPDDQEWSAAVGIGAKEKRTQNSTPEMLSGIVDGEYPWGSDWPPPTGAGNYGDLTWRERFAKNRSMQDYSDGFATTAPVMSFRANAFGLYDMGGNVSEWVNDWWNAEQKVRVLRGGSWEAWNRQSLIASSREKAEPERRSWGNGFRCVLDLSGRPRARPAESPTPTPTPVPKPSSPAPTASSSTPTPATPAALAATPKPQSETQKWLAQVEAIYQPMWQKEVITPYESGMDDLKKTTLSALDAQIATASRAAKLQDALAFRNERQRIEAGQGVPANDSDAPPAVLKTLRDIYRKESTQLEADWRKHSASVFAQFDQVLATNQAALTQHQRLDEALELQLRRDALKKEWMGSPPKLGTPAAATKERPFVNSLGMKFVPVPIVGGPTNGQRMLFSVWETRVRDYELFAREKSRKWDKATDVEQGPTYPVVNVSWNDATAFCTWLTRRERTSGEITDGEEYRLPLDHEWSCAVGIGDQDDLAKPLWQRGATRVYPWGSVWPPPPKAANFPGEELRSEIGARKHPKSKVIEGYRDDFIDTAPVGSFAPNGFGIYDLGGNVAEVCSDESTPPAEYVLRGADWAEMHWQLAQSGTRESAGARSNRAGFRCVLAPVVFSITPASGSNSIKPASAVVASPSATPVPSPTPRATAAPATPTPRPASTAGSRADAALAQATKEAPFVNSLGMKFVPVPDTKVLFCIHETRNKDFAAFVAETPDLSHDWSHRKDGFARLERSDEHPVMLVNWNRAHDFCAWLGAKEGRVYRLPTDKEWSFAVGIGHKEKWSSDTTPEMRSKKSVPNEWPWGNRWPPPDGAGNFGQGAIGGYTDPYATTAPVMSFTPNKLGIFDLSGNVAEMCEDWFNANQTERVVRGEGWGGGERGRLLSSYRRPNRHANATDWIGFRCVVELPEP